MVSRRSILLFTLTSLLLLLFHLGITGMFGGVVAVGTTGPFPNLYSKLDGKALVVLRGAGLVMEES